MEQGYQSFGYIAGWEGASTQRDREAGFTAALAENGLELGFRAVGNFRTDKLMRLQNIAGQKNQPEAIFVTNDANGTCCYGCIAS